VRTCESKRKVQVIQGVDADGAPVVTVYQHLDDGSICRHRLMGQLQPGDSEEIDRIVPAFPTSKGARGGKADATFTKALERS